MTDTASQSPRRILPPGAGCPTHSVGGHVTAGSLFALGLSSWQVLVALLIGIVNV